MRIGVLADTHSLDIPSPVLEDFKKTDLIIHAGDFCSVKDLELLRRIKGVRGVYGNMDGADIRQVFPRREMLKLEGVTIGIFHGEGAPERLLEVVQNEFKGENVQAVVFGHSHQPLNRVINQVLYFNPGSPNDLVFAPYRSYGILEIQSGRIQGKIIKLKG